MSASLKASADGTQAIIAVGGVDKLSIQSNGIVLATATPSQGDNTGALATTAFLMQNSLGQGQTWQNMTSSRVLGNNYTNTTGRPIYISVTTNSTVSAGVNIVVEGVNAAGGSAWPSGGGQAYASAIIPAGASYSASVSAGTGTILNWAELR